MSSTAFNAALAERLKLSQRETAELLEVVTETILAECRAGNSVRLSGFGTFRPHVREERTMHSALTGGQVTVPGQTRLMFKPYKPL